MRLPSLDNRIAKTASISDCVYGLYFFTYRILVGDTIFTGKSSASSSWFWEVCRVRRTQPNLLGKTRLGRALGLTGVAAMLATGIGIAPGNAVSAKPKPPASAVSNARVMPLPAGSWAWSAGFGVSGPLWASGRHTGQDLSATFGTPIVAAAAGIVISTGDGGPYGNLTQIQHPGDVQTWYAHQSVISTEVGVQVKAGQVIGAVGSTGNSTGPHLHFEVRLGGAQVDPKPWLEGAPAVAVAGGVTFDPAVADQLRGELAEAEAAGGRAEQKVAEMNKRLVGVSTTSDAASAGAERARAILLSHVREVYKAGLDPQWLLQTEALESGDLKAFADRSIMLEYTNDARNQQVQAAIAALATAQELREEVASLKAEARQTLDDARVKMLDLQTRLDATQGVSLVGTQFDGVIPQGGSRAASEAVALALKQVGKKFTDKAKNGTGPRYSASGLTWRVWREAGSKWPKQKPNTQALNRRWIAPIEPGQEQPGDLIYFRMDNGTDLEGRIDHVGIIVNPLKGVFVHASSPKTGVELNNYRTSSYYEMPAMFGRVLGVPDAAAANKAKKAANNKKKQKIAAVTSE
jgi:cell wall-associated NlpC family hydrolase